jgi:hypothetical protein
MSFSEVPPLNVGGGAAASDVKRLKAEMEDLLRERRQVRYKGIRVLFCMAVFWVPLCARWGRADRLVSTVWRTLCRGSLCMSQSLPPFSRPASAHIMRERHSSRCACG